MKQRDNSIDILRGLAIFAMIAANMAPYNFIEPHPVWFRFIGSLAAPMFVFLAGMMVSFTSVKKGHPFNYYLKRALATICVAMLIDSVIWQIFPLVTFDVLYVIGLSMPIIYLVNKKGKLFHLLFVILIFVLTPILHYFWGYAETPQELGIALNEIKGYFDIPVLKQFLVEGWFPIFPWLGVSLFGAYIGRIKFQSLSGNNDSKILLMGVFLFMIGVISWFIFNPSMSSNNGFENQFKNDLFWRHLITRQGYSELFYPPTLFFMSTFLGAILILLVMFKKLNNIKIFNWLTVFGKSSMLVYLMHTVFIAAIFSSNQFFGISMGPYSLAGFIILFMIHSTFLWLLCFSVQKFKKDKNLPFIVNFILGG